MPLTQLELRILTHIREYIGSHQVSPTIAEVADGLSIRSRGTVHRYVQSLIEKGRLERHGTGWRGLRLADTPSDETTARNRSGSQATSSRQNASGMPEFVPKRTNSREQQFQGSNIQGVDMSVLRLESSQDQAHNGENLTIPLLGRIAAGMPIEAIPDEDHLDLAAFFIGPDRYALRVTGESMIDVGILDGDTVIIRKQSTARSGDIVVALIDSQEATLKRLGEYTSQVVELIAENQLIPKMRYSASRVSIQGVLIGQLRSY